MRESDLMRSIMLALSGAGHFVFRCNVGLFYTKDGRPVVARSVSDALDIVSGRSI